MPLPELNSLPTLGDFGQAAKDAATAAAKAAATGALPGTGLIFGFSAGNIVIIILGLLLIAAGIFSIKEVKETAGTVAKVAASAA